MGVPIDVVVFLNGAREGNTPLETVATTTDERVSITVLVWGESEGDPYGLETVDLGASSRLDLSGYRRLAAYLSDNDPDILHVHPIAIGTGATVIARALGIPVVTTEHNTHASYGPLKTSINGVANALRSVVVSNSQATEDSFASWEHRLMALAGTKQSVIHYGPNIERIDRCRRERTPPELPDGVVIGTGGRLSPQKNLETLIDAMAQLVPDHPDTYLLITGEGPLRDSLEAQARDLGLGDHIQFLGWLPEQADVFAFYDAIDVFAFPSHYEGFGMANAEAMAAGTPVVANDIDVLREVVGDAGVLVDATDVDALADGLQTLIADSDLRAELGQRARQRMESTFSIRRSAEKYAELYVDLAT